MGWLDRVVRSTRPFVVAGIVLPAVASADEPTPHAKFVAWVATGDKLMSSISAMKLQPERTLDTETGTVKTLREGVAKMQANTGKMPPDDQKLAQAYAERATHWADATMKTLTDETTGRADVVVPLCDAYTDLENLRADLAREKSNPSGVVNLAELHKIGEMIQSAQDAIKELTPKYTAFRHHAYTSWRDEGACVQAYADREAADKGGN
jgi:hypothetical protein